MLSFRQIERLFDPLLGLVYPQACAVCGGSVESHALGVACAGCWQRTHIFSADESLCWKCGAPARGISRAKELVRCHRCDLDCFSAARACGTYEGALRASVLHLKREPHVSSFLKNLLVSLARLSPLSNATLIVPVPLHPERERARGFNQAVVLAHEIAKATSLPISQKSLMRLKHVQQHRAGMDAKGRKDTVAGAFTVTRPSLIANERVLLVDDVFTTGATASACARGLIDAGALEVSVITIARAL